MKLHGHKFENIMALAADIQENAPSSSLGPQYIDYVEERMIPGAKNELMESGNCEVNGYLMSDVIGCAFRIADELETHGYLTIED